MQRRRHDEEERKLEESDQVHTVWFHVCGHQGAGLTLWWHDGGMGGLTVWSLVFYSVTDARWSQASSGRSEMVSGVNEPLKGVGNECRRRRLAIRCAKTSNFGSNLRRPPDESCHGVIQMALIE
jgi:hypothetical protein